MDTDAGALTGASSSHFRPRRHPSNFAENRRQETTQKFWAAVELPSLAHGSRGGSAVSDRLIATIGFHHLLGLPS
jgi:hypothetical protein